MPGKDLVSASTKPATVHVPLATEPVSALNVEVQAQALYNYCHSLFDGKIVVQSGVTTLVNSGGAITCNGTATFNGVGGSKTVIAELAVGDAGAVFTGPLTGQIGELTWPVSPSDRRFAAQENNSATVSASCAFTMKRDITVAQSIPVGGGGIETEVLWETPGVPWVLDGMVLQVVSTCTADADPGDVNFYVYVDGLLTAIIGTMSAFEGGGTTYIVDNTTDKKVIFGMKTAEKGTLLSPPFTDSGDDKRGLALDDVNLTVAALALGDTFGLFNRPITLRVAHTSGSSRTLTLPLRLIAWGRLL